MNRSAAPRLHRAWAAAVLVLAASLTGCNVTPADMFLYHPERALEGTPALLGLPYEDVWFAAEDAVRLHGWFVPAPEAAATTLLWFHGNAGNISHRLDLMRLLRERLPVHLFLFDYRGYGRSGGRPSEEGLYRDARAALDALRRHHPARPEGIVYFGQSLGSAVAVELATRERPGGLVLEAPFTSVRDMGRATFPFLPVNLLVRNLFDSLGRIGRARAPLLILHGDRDEVVPYEQGRRLFAAAGEPKTFHAVRGAGHNDLALVGGAPYFEAWSRFLARLGRSETAL